MLAGPAWLIDLSRSVSRLARGPLTGIDRVELAYLRYLLGRPEPLFGLVRTALGFVLLDRPGVQGILDRAAQIDDIKAIVGKDLEVTKDGDKIVVGFAYNKEIHLGGPAYLLLKYAGKSK